MLHNKIHTSPRAATTAKYLLSPIIFRWHFKIFLYMKHLICKHIKLHSKFQICLNEQTGSSSKCVIFLYHASELGEAQKDILSPMKPFLSISHNHKIRSSLQILEPLDHFQLCLYNCSPCLHRKGPLCVCNPKTSGNLQFSLQHWESSWR